MVTDLNERPPLACDLTAIPADVREEHVITAPQLFTLAQEVQELSNGYVVPSSTLDWKLNRTADRSGCG